MSLTDPNAESPDEDYDRIESAVLETARGRWFLREFSRRQRQQPNAGQRSRCRTACSGARRAQRAP